MNLDGQIHWNGCISKSLNLHYVSACWCRGNEGCILYEIGRLMALLPLFIYLHLLKSSFIFLSQTFSIGNLISYIRQTYFRRLVFSFEIRIFAPEITASAVKYRCELRCARDVFLSLWLHARYTRQMTMSHDERMYHIHYWIRLSFVVNVIWKFPNWYFSNVYWSYMWRNYL